MKLISYTCRPLGTHLIAKGVKATYEDGVLMIECCKRITAVSAQKGEELIIRIDNSAISVYEKRKSRLRGANSESGKTKLTP